MNPYIIFIIGFICSLGLTLILMPKLIDYLHKIKFGQTEREEGLESHKKEIWNTNNGWFIIYLCSECFVSFI